MIEIEIDGKPLQVEQGTMVIEAADNAGIYIPRFCYHKKLSIAANCRMCLVEIEKSPKTLPACATPVTPGMKVFTRSKKTLESQRAVMEFLLINHPLDCPICDQGGECELQDLSMGYGADNSRFAEGKRSVADEDIGPLVKTYMTRCIQCTRCVRFGQEVAGLRELGAISRGENMEISTYVKHSMQSELSGNIIDLCPVGALTSKPFLFSARAWELIQSASIAPHDCLGSNVYIHTRRDEVMRVVPKDNETINENWLSDRDRFSYLGINSSDRLKKPMIKRDNVWQETDWPTALNFAVDGFKKIIIQENAQQIGALASPSSTLEEFYLLQKLMRGLGSNHIDHRLHQTDFRDQNAAGLFPGLTISLQAIETQKAILLIGSNVRLEQPLLNHRVRLASLQGAHIFCINPLDYHFNFNVEQKSIVNPLAMVTELCGLIKALITIKPQTISAELQQFLNSAKPTTALHIMAEKLLQEENKLILLGALALNHPEASTLRWLAQWLVKLSGANIGYLTEGANSAGAWFAGAIPHREAGGIAVKNPGFDIQSALKAQLKGLLLLNLEPELDCANAHLAMQALKSAQWVVALTSFKSDTLLEYANVLLPMATYAENAGTYINVEGRWQSFTAAAPVLGEGRPAWKILRVLGNLFEIPRFDYNAVEDVRDELQALQNVSLPNKEITEFKPAPPQSKAMPSLTRITEWPIYSVDTLVRRATALQQSGTVESVGIRINAITAQHMHLQEGTQAIITQDDQSTKLPIIIDARVPENCVALFAGCAETAMLGASFAEVKVQHD